MNCTRRNALINGLLGAFAVSTGIAVANPSNKSTGAYSLTDILTLHTNARGGAAAIDAINSEMVDLELTEKGSTIKAVYRCSKAPYFRIDIYDHDKHVFCEGLDADGPWIWPGDQPAPRQGVPEAKKTGLQGIEFNLYGLHALASLGNTLSLSGRERIEEVDYFVVQVDLKDSYQTFLYLDPETWMVRRRRDFRSFHPDLGTTKKLIETQYTDFRLVSGVRTAFLQHTVELNSGEITSVAVTKKLTYNPPEVVGVFARTYKVT